MAFWSSQTLERRLGELVDKPSEAGIDCNAIELRVGSEIYVTPNLEDVRTSTKRLLDASEPFLIPPGQFAFLLTEEIVTVPATAMAFISMKATFKMKGLVNVSGFHVDPGWTGRLIFAVFNAGPAPVHLQRGLRLFLIWYASLDDESKKRKTEPGSPNIPPAIISNLTGGHDSIFELDKRLTDTKKALETEHKDLRERIHKIDNAQTTIKVILSALFTLAVGLAAFLFRESILPRASQPTSQMAPDERAASDAGTSSSSARPRTPNAEEPDRTTAPSPAPDTKTAEEKP